MNLQTLKPLTLLVIIFSTLFSSCHKHEEEQPPASKEFKVEFSAESISFVAVDSVKVTFTTVGRNSIVKTLARNPSVYQTSLEDLPAGTWTAEIRIYSKKPNTRNILIYEKMVPVNIPLIEDFKLAAPVNAQPDNTWRINTILSNSVEISFSASSIAIEKVDSVKMQFKQLTTTKLLDGVKTGDKYVVDVQDLSAGNWTVECKVYARTLDFTRRIYIDTIDLTLPVSPSIALPAPTGKIDDVWEGYIVMQAMTDVLVITAVDNTNPFFEIQVKDPAKWAYFYKDRHAYNKVGTTNTVVESASWECQDQCYNLDGNKIRNTSAFANFSKSLVGKSWNNTEIMLLLVGISQADDLTFFYKYDK